MDPATFGAVMAAALNNDRDGDDHDEGIAAGARVDTPVGGVPRANADAAARGPAVPPVTPRAARGQGGKRAVYAWRVLPDHSVRSQFPIRSEPCRHGVAGCWPSPLNTCIPIALLPPFIIHPSKGGASVNPKVTVVNKRSTLLSMDGRVCVD